MRKWCDLPEDFYRIDSLEENGFRIEFLQSLGVDTDNIPETFYEIVEHLHIKEKEISRLANEQVVFIKDVVGTTYRDYSNITWIQAYKRIKRGYNYAQRLVENPNLYFWQLQRHIEDQWTPQVPITFIKSCNKYYIYSNGNHRTILYKIMYLAALKQARTEDEIKNIQKKFYMRAMVIEI